MDDFKTHTSYLDWSLEGESGIGRYVGGLVLAVICFFFSGVFALPIESRLPGYEKSLVLSLLITMLEFAFAFVAIPLIVRVIHQRPAWSVAMPALRFEAWNFGVGLAVGGLAGVLGPLAFGVTGLMPLERNPAFDPRTLALAAVVALGALFIQTGAEELLFRGYLMQFARRLTANKYVVIGVPALLFMAIHIDNISNFGGSLLLLSAYLVSGLLFGWAAWRSGSLWMALALHLANNYTSVVFVGTKGDALPSAAPLLVTIPNAGMVSAAILVTAIVQFLALSFLMKRAGR